MTKIITDEQNYYNIADAIRGKLDVETLYLPSEMAAAIETIETGTELTSEDEGKVVVEDDGAYVLAEQTSQTIAQNGTYDTTTNDEVVVTVQGGESTNVLSGSDTPSASYGSDGSMYLQFSDDVEVSDFLSKTEYNMTVTQSGNSVSFQYKSGSAIGAHVYKEVDFTDIDAVKFSFEIGTKHYNRSTDKRFNPTVAIIPTSSGFNPASSFMSVSNVETYGVWSGMGLADGSADSVVIDVSSVTGECYLLFAGTGCTVDFTDIEVGISQYLITDVYLKVNGTWVPIEGQDIDDVNTGGGGGGDYTIDWDTAVVLREGSMTITAVGDTITFAWSSGSQIGANAFMPIYIPENSGSIKYTLSTGGSYGTTDPRKLCVGIRPISAGMSSFVFNTSTLWEVVDVYDTNNLAEAEHELDTSQISGGKLLCISAHGWNATIKNVEVSL
jgi:hypothetical protein